MTDSERVEQFVQLVTRYQQRVYLFILSLLQNEADADEVLQETNLVLWRRFDEFEPGTDFRAWAFQIAFNKVQSFREKQGRQKLRFGDAFQQRVADVAASSPDDHDERRSALASCMQKLTDRDRDLIERRYRPRATAKSAAEETGRSVHAVYKSLLRIRRLLHDCIQRTLAMEGRP